MKLKGIKITNAGGLKKYFDLPQVWENVENGVLLEFEQSIREPGEQKLAQEIALVLEGISQPDTLAGQAISGGAADRIRLFYGESGWNLEGLKKALEPFARKSLDHDRQDFFLRNYRELEDVTRKLPIEWNEAKAGCLYLFLLLMLQVKPKEKIQKAEAEFIKQKLCSMKDPEKLCAPVQAGARIYPYDSGFLYWKEGAIYDSLGKRISPENEWIMGYAYTDELGILAFTKDGALSEMTDQNLRREIMRKNCGQDKILMVSAYGSLYIFLTEKGVAGTNAEDDISGWKDIRWVGAGLNSITAVRGNMRNILQLGMEDKLTEFSEVSAVYTYNGDERHYGVLKNNGRLILDDQELAGAVSAAYLYRKGCLYAVDNVIYQKDFSSHIEYKWEAGIPEKEKFIIKEICRNRNRICFRYLCGEQEHYGLIDCAV